MTELKTEIKTTKFTKSDIKTMDESLVKINKARGDGYSKITISNVMREATKDEIKRLLRQIEKGQ